MMDDNARRQVGKQRRRRRLDETDTKRLKYLTTVETDSARALGIKSRAFKLMLFKSSYRVY